MQYYITLIQDDQTASLSTLNCWNLGKSIIKPSVLETKQAHLLWDSPTARIANIPAISFLCNVPPFWPHFQYRISHISFPSPFFLAAQWDLQRAVLNCPGVSWVVIQLTMTIGYSFISVSTKGAWEGVQDQQRHMYCWQWNLAWSPLGQRGLYSRQRLKWAKNNLS